MRWKGLGTIGPMGRWVSLAIMVAALLAAALLSACSIDKPKTIAPDFELTDQRGQAISLGALRGHVAILTFLYTHCPDTCPLYLFTIDQALAEMDSADTISVVVVTVDPERDTVDYLAQFAGSWSATRYFLTGRPAQVARVWSSYGVYVERKDPREHGDAHSVYEVIHAARVILIDKDGRFSTELKGDWSAAELRQKLGLLLGGERIDSGANLLDPLLRLALRCGEFASSHPWTFAGLVLLIMLPGLALPAYLFRTFLFTNKRP